MANIEYSPSQHCTTLCLNKEETKALIPLIRRALKKALVKEDKYRDIHESGEASERQETKLMKCEDEVSMLDGLLSLAKELVK